MSAETILIVDDEPNILLSLGRALELEDYRPQPTQSGIEALERAASQRPDVVLLDVAMPEMDGLEVLRQLKQRDPELPVIMMSGHSTIETAVQATKLGAYDFVEKPLSTDRLLITIQNALDAVRLRAENAELRKLAAGEADMIGSSPQMKAILETIRKTAPTNGRVLITGANGTGKELVARALHQQSRRAEGPFVKVNCAAIPQELIESELFGHEKGAFTGATSLRRGKFEQADGGTLFLDEIGDMSLGAQAKVLRVLQEGELERVGGSEVRVDVRVIAATNKNLADEIAAGQFREDLYYRLNVVPIVLPTLRQRKADIPQLVDHFVAVACRDHGKRAKTIESGAVTLLMQHDWPGNVRELRNSIERLVILTEGDAIGEADVQAIVLPAAKPAKSHFRAGASLRDMMTSAERDIILRALADSDGHVSKTASVLQVERSHLYKKMRALGIDPKKDLEQQSQKR